MRFFFLFLLVFCFSISASANTERIENTVKQLIKIGANDEIVSVLSEAIEESKAKNQIPPANLLFYRGEAAFRIGWFSMAEEDMGEVVKTTHPDLQKRAKAILDQLGEAKKALPPRTLEVTQGGRVVFRVYYFDNHPVARLIIQTLPEAYKVNVALLQTDVVEIPVFVFNTQSQLKNFYKAMKWKPPSSWAWATGGSTSFQFCLEKPDGTPVYHSSVSYIRSTVAHEYNHSIFMRAMGRVSVPKWFLEGLAQIAGGMVSPSDIVANERAVFKLFKADMLVPMNLLSSGSSFTEHTEYGSFVSKMSKATNREMLGPNPYAQSYHMTRYLLRSVDSKELVAFLNKVRDNQSFDRGFNEFFGATQEQFFASWHRECLNSFK